MKKLASTFSLFLIIAMAFSFLPSGVVLAAAGPTASAIAVSPTPVVLGVTEIVAATVTSTTSNIQSAEYSLDNGVTFTPMSAIDGAFDALSEDVSATFKLTTAGTYTVCVRGTDMLAIIGDTVCLASFTVLDTLGPITSAVLVTPTPVLLNGKAAVTALVDDTITGGSKIFSAEYSLDGGAFKPMTAKDGAIDAVSEAVTAAFTATTVGQHTVCVHGTDVIPNTGDSVCSTFNVFYVFKSFKPPVRMGKINSAKGGQAIPLKWQLTDANGKGISTPASFVAVKSYAVDCASGIGDPSTATIESAPGNSGLKYQGNGNWQFNWKTLKSYSSAKGKGHKSSSVTCRKMFVAFNSGQNSPEVMFQFK